MGENDFTIFAMTFGEKNYVSNNIGIQIKRKELTKTFIMNSNWKNIFGVCGLYANISAL